MVGCGGTLIGPSVVLTAAHCGKMKGRKVTIGGSYVRTLSQMMIHSDYDSNTKEYDFALYNLSSAIPISKSKNSTQIRFNSRKEVPTTGRSLTTMGYGFTSEGGVVSERLRHVNVPTWSIEDCSAIFGTSYVSDVMICAGGEKGKDACNGDSGGPLVIRNGNIHTIVGIVSFGAGCAREGIPGVYSRVSAITPWMKDIVCTQWSTTVNGIRC